MSAKLYAVSASLIIMSSTAGAIAANQARYDKKVQRAAAEIAASQLGNIRGSIDHDEKPVFIENKEESSLLPATGRTASPYERPEPELDKSLPPITQHVEGIDQTATGSIAPEPQSNNHHQLWDWFDSEGNRIDRYGNLID